MLQRDCGYIADCHIVSYCAIACQIGLDFSFDFCSTKSMKKQDENTAKSKKKKGTKNICESTLRGKPCWIVNLTVAKGKRIKRYFPSERLAKEFLRTYKIALQTSITDIAELSPERILDIRNAIKICPPELSLTEVLRKYLKIAHSPIKLNDAYGLYKREKEKILKKEPELRIDKFFVEFKSWEEATPDRVREWLLTRGKPKTIKEYRSELSQFYKFCIRREIIKESPLEKVSAQDLPKVVRTDCAVWEIDDLKIFFDFLENKRPHQAAWFAIACFAGIRRAEINRIKPGMIDFENRRIVLPYDIVKTGETWEMSGLSENLWKWLEAYEFKTISDSAFDKLTTEAFPKFYKEYFTERGMKKSFEWGHNICRHSFCTFDLSLHRDPIRTSMLLKHRLPDAMWQHYLAKLVSKKAAESYFAILPKSRQTIL